MKMSKRDAMAAINRAKRVLLFARLSDDTERMQGTKISKHAAGYMVKGVADGCTVRAEWLDDGQTVLALG